MVTISQGLTDVTEFASDIGNRLASNPVASAVGGAVVGGVVVGAVAKAISSRKKSTRKSAKKKRTSTRKRKARHVRRKASGSYARTAGKRRDTSTKRIRMTKNGQPYVIMKSGKARFISKSSARASRKRKGGRY